MRYLVDVTKDKAPIFLRLVKSHKYIKVQPVVSDDDNSSKIKEKQIKRTKISSTKRNSANMEKQRILKSIEKGVKEVNLYMNGKIKLKDARDFLNEL